MVRVRPLNNKELSADYRNIVHVDPIHGTVRLDQLNGPDRSRDAPPKVSILLLCMHYLRIRIITSIYHILVIFSQMMQSNFRFSRSILCSDQIAHKWMFTTESLDQ